MSRACVKQERLSVWLRMKSKPHQESFERDSKRLKISPDAEEEEIDVVGEEDATVATVQSRFEAASYLQLLPRELLVMIMHLLDHDSLISLAEVMPDCKPLAVGDSTLRLHFQERGELLASIVDNEQVWKRVSHRTALLDYLTVRINFFRHLPDQRGLQKREVSTNFIFGVNSEAKKNECLLKFAKKRFDYNTTHVLVVVANNAAEGKAMVKALEDAKHSAFFMTAWPCNQVWNRILDAGRKFFLVVDRLDTQFHFRSMTAILYFKPLKTSVSHNVLHAVNPGSVFLYFDSNSHHQMTIAKDLFEDLQWRNDRLTLYVLPNNFLEIVMNRFCIFSDVAD